MQCCAGLQSEAATTLEKLKVRNKDMKEAVNRLELLQGSKEKVEAELHACIKQKRKAHLAWNEQRSMLDTNLQVLFSLLLHDVCHKMPAAFDRANCQYCSFHHCRLHVSDVRVFWLPPR
jgi:hypothetical protein